MVYGRRSLRRPWVSDATGRVPVTDHESDAVFAGSVPEVYERCLVPLIFECYADDLVERVADLAPGSVLEIAAGTGVVTRALAVGTGRVG